MKTKINNFLTLVTAQVPAVFCATVGFFPKWLVWGGFVFCMVFGIVLLWKMHKKTIGVSFLVGALFFLVLGIYNLNKTPQSNSTVELGDDPLLSFFQLGKDAQSLWESQDVHLIEEMAIKALAASIQMGSQNYSFAYYDNIWNKLEMAKRAGSADACYNMAIMCLNGLGRPRSIDDAVELCQKAITIDSNHVDSYILLEELHIDSVKYPDTYAQVKKWGLDLDEKISYYNKRFAEISSYYGALADLEGAWDQYRMREESFKKIYYSDTSSRYWKLIDEFCEYLQAEVSGGNVSVRTLYLAAYYYGKGNRDAAVYYYERFLESNELVRAMTKPIPQKYSFVPDTVILVYSRNVMQFLLGLDELNLDFYSYAVGSLKLSSDTGLDFDTLNLYLACTLWYAYLLKNNRFDPYFNKREYYSNGFKRDINNLLKTKRDIIGRSKSPKYKYNFLLDIYDEPNRDYLLNKKKLAIVPLFDLDSTVVFADCYEVDKNPLKIQRRLNKYIFLHGIIQKKDSTRNEP